MQRLPITAGNRLLAPILMNESAPRGLYGEFGRRQVLMLSSQTITHQVQENKSVPCSAAQIDDQADDADRNGWDTDIQPTPKADAVLAFKISAEVIKRMSRPKNRASYQDPSSGDPKYTTDHHHDYNTIYNGPEPEVSHEYHADQGGDYQCFL
jgi:hypothetical protein